MRATPALDVVLEPPTVLVLVTEEDAAVSVGADGEVELEKALDKDSVTVPVVEAPALEVLEEDWPGREVVVEVTSVELVLWSFTPAEVEMVERPEVLLDELELVLNPVDELPAPAPAEVDGVDEAPFAFPTVLDEVESDVVDGNVVALVGPVQVVWGT